MRKYNKTLEDLYNDLYENHYTMVEKPRYDVLDEVHSKIMEDNIQGDGIECGIWRGGCLVYLSYLFNDRKIWGFDSFCGFQDTLDAKYEYGGERHTKELNLVGMLPGGHSISIPIEDVQGTLTKFGLDKDKDIKLVPGYVRDTTDPKNLKNLKIDKIAVLRIDVDGYSPTMEVLVNMFDLVVPGGFIIFDDVPLHECRNAISDFSRMREIPIPLEGDSKQDGYYGGCYYRKV